MEEVARAAGTLFFSEPDLLNLSQASVPLQTASGHHRIFLEITFLFFDRRGRGGELGSRAGTAGGARRELVEMLPLCAHFAPCLENVEKVRKPKSLLHLREALLSAIGRGPTQWPKSVSRG